MPNGAPTLSGFLPSVTFGENDPPQLLDGSVIFLDVDDNFDGGLLTVAGLLAEDRVAIQNEGVGAGQIGVSGGNVTYGGTVIGAFAGGIGATLTVTFNASATSASIDALIQHLTYANVSDAPTASRTLVLNVADATGADLHAVGQPTFTLLSGAADPFHDLPHFQGINPEFIDLDADGDLDMVSGEIDGTIRVFRNDGTAFNELTGPANPFAGIDVGDLSTPAFGDLDGDNDLDLIVGDLTGHLLAWRNDNGVFTALAGAANPLNGVDVGTRAAPVFVDLDNDGDADLVVGTQSGNLLYFRNTGGVFTQQNGGANPFSGISGPLITSPGFADLDGDGDLDLGLGTLNSLIAYRNDGGIFTQPLTTTFSGTSGDFLALGFADLDGDGDLDGISAYESTGVLGFLENAGQQIIVNVTAQNDSPIASDDVLAALEDVTITFTAAQILGNDSDPDDSILVIQSVTSVSGGTATLNANGSVTFASGSNYNGPASFTYIVSDGHGGTDQGAVNVNVAAVNDRPTLSGLAPSFNFAENTVNAAPALLDNGVTLGDVEGNFGGGMLTVAGLLSEDRISVRDQGNGAGEIGVSGSDILYGGIVIGSFSGGVGTMFTVALNGAATTASVEALIENLAYANASDTPTLSRALLLNVSDGDGGGIIVAPPAFTLLSGAADPFHDLPHFQGINPEFIDLDADGDLDMVSGEIEGTIRVFRNDGTAFNELTGPANPFAGIDVGELSTPAFGDLDGDNDLDLIVGDLTGHLLAWRNDNGVFTALAGAANPLNGVDVGTRAAPVFVDLDNDGDADLVVGTQSGNLVYFRNTGGVFTQQNGGANPFSGISGPLITSPGFADLDGDGDLDLGLGTLNSLMAYRNDGGIFTQPLTTTFSGMSGDFLALGFADLDGDGDLDGISAYESTGVLGFLENAGQQIIVNVTAQSETLSLSGLATSTTYDENIVNATPQLLDADVTLIDTHASFYGVTVSVSGLLGEDAVAVRDQGSGAGQIGVSGADVSYGGTLIGSLSGGVGATLAVILNADATRAAVEALIENLTYATASDTPAASRSLLVNIARPGDTDTEQSIDVHVTAQNDMPYIDLDYTDSPATGTTATYLEGDLPLTIAPLAIVSDADQPANYGGYVLTVLFTANGTADDQLEVQSIGFGSNEILVSGNDISYGGTLVATFSGGENGAPLVISFNADACGCSLEAITAAIGFSNVSDHPSTLDREITFTVDDGALADSSASAVAIVSVIGNDPPVLTDLDPSVTFAENLVNQTPQLLDAHVTLADPDGNFDGGTLTITGLLLEDEIGVRNVGTGPGEISVSGGDISYGGVLIGSMCGCTGDSETIQFNADATTAAVQAVIENLTYANHSDSPTASRTLLINVTDAAGADLGEAPGGGAVHFSPLAGSGNPFHAVALYGLTAPVFVDLDGDGDLDVVVGDASGSLYVVGNDSGFFTQRADADNPFHGLLLDYAARPAFIDVDGDSDLDLVVGGHDGTLQLFENDGGTFTELTGADNVFGAIAVDEFAAPVFVDLDGDGDLDLVVGDGYGSLYAFDNDGGIFTELTGAANPFEAILVDYNAAPTFVDLDGDGDLDLVVGDNYGGVSAFQNDGGAFTALAGGANPFNAILAYGYASPAFADLDGDGDLDLIVGEGIGTISAFQNGPARGVPIVVNVTPENDAPLLDLDYATSPDVDTTASFTEGDQPLTIAPFAIFADPDQPANYGGYVVTVEISQNATAADMLAIANIGPGPSEIEVSGSDILYEGVVVASFTGGSNGDPLVITFNGDACACSVELTLANVLFSNASEDPSELTRSIVFTIDDGAGGTASATASVTVTAVEDAAIANDDAVSTPEDVAIIGASLFGNDGDVDGPVLQIAAVNGAPPDFGHAITLASGALLTIRADGTYDYDPNGRFGTLTDPSGGETGAVNVSATDSFTYTLAGGNMATVTVTLNGVANAADHLEGDAGDNIITGTPAGDYLDLSQGGNDHASGLGGNDGYYFGAAYTNADVVNDSGGTNDQIGLKGDYSGGVTLGTITGIEALVVLPGFSYDITTVDANVVAGGVLNVQATQLAVGQSLTFNGSAETDGAFKIFGGNGDDNLTGGAGNDGFYFGPGGFNSADIVNGGGGINDQLALDGDYTITLGGNVTNVEVLVLLHGPTGTPNHFDITTSDAFVAAGQTMTIFGLQVETSILFDGSGELDGAFKIYGGTNSDTLTGGHGADWIFGGNGADGLTGGAGNDIFYYDAIAQSTAANSDTISDFASGDRIDVSGIDAIAGGANDAFTYLGSGAFTNHAGELRAVNGGGNTWLVQGDTNGDGVADFQLSFIAGDAHPITSADFTL